MSATPIQLRLARLNAADIELVRTWRNDPRVSRYMEFRGTITPEQQKRWFDSINNDSNYYFIVEHGAAKVGLINLRHVDRQAGTGEGGLFFAPDYEAGAIVAFAVVLALYDFAFDTLGLRTTQAHILRDNERAIRYNLALGYELHPGQADVENQLYLLSPERYRTATAAIRRMVSRGCKVTVDAGNERLP